jgi:Sigma-54 interaction domain
MVSVADRVGSTWTHQVDVRVGEATNRNLVGLAKRNEFRRDLLAARVEHLCPDSEAQFVAKDLFVRGRLKLLKRAATSLRLPLTVLSRSARTMNLLGAAPK